MPSKMLRSSVAGHTIRIMKWVFLNHLDACYDTYFRWGNLSHSIAQDRLRENKSTNRAITVMLRFMQAVII